MNLLRKILSFGQTPYNEKRRLSYTPIGGDTYYYYDDIDMSIEIGDKVELNDLGKQYKHAVDHFPDNAIVIGIQEDTDKYSGYRHITVENAQGEPFTVYNNIIKKSI